MRKIINGVSMLALFVISWLVVNNGFSIFNIIIGIALCALSIFVSGKLLELKYIKEFYLPFFATVKYIFFMFYSIYKAGFQATYMILKGDVSPIFTDVKINKEIKNTYLHNIIANSVTLTPGTITIDSNNGDIKILCLHKTTAKESTISNFEPFMLEVQNKLNKQNK